MTIKADTAFNPDMDVTKWRCVWRAGDGFSLEATPSVRYPGAVCLISVRTHADAERSWVWPPNLLERLFGVTFESKVRRTVARQLSALQEEARISRREGMKGLMASIAKMEFPE